MKIIAMTQIVNSVKCPNFSDTRRDGNVHAQVIPGRNSERWTKIGSQLTFLLQN